MNTSQNRRVLLVDDTPTIHADFRKILEPEPVFSDLDADEAFLFDQKEAAGTVRFEMQSAHQGREGLEKVRAAKLAGLPFAMAFIDMRMPPGWDGVETVEHLWKEDPRLQIVLCTAYSDCSWNEVLTRLDVRDRLLILKKPFDPIEVYQFANALTASGSSRMNAWTTALAITGLLSHNHARTIVSWSSSGITFTVEGRLASSARSDNVPGVLH